MQAEQSIYGRPAPVQAERAGVSLSTINRAIRNGLKASRVGGSWKIRDEDLDAFVEQRTAKALGDPRPTESSTPGPSRDELAVMDRALAARGF